MSKHTPGPWVWLGKLRQGGCLNSAHGPVIDYAGYEGMWFARYGNPDEDEANARLIAAAPDLLEACRRLVALTAAQPLLADEIDIPLVRAAIAKAEGKPEPMLGPASPGE